MPQLGNRNNHSSHFQTNTGYEVGEHGNRKLLSEQELDAVFYLRIASACKRPIARKDVKKCIKSMFGIDCTDQFAASFLNRWSALLTVRKAEIITSARTSERMLEELEHFCDDFQFITEHYQVNANNLVNVDETRVAMDRNNFIGLQVVSSTGVAGNNLELHHDSTTVTIVPFCAANGETLCVFLIFRAKSKKDMPKMRLIGDQSNIRESPRGKRPWKYYYMVTQTGYVDSEAYLMICKAFSEEWETHHPGLKCFLLADRLRAHLQPGFMQEMIGKGIMPVYLAANTSHFAQPLDGKVFALFKKQFRQLVTENARYKPSVDGIPNTSVMIAIYDSLKIALQPAVIQKSFKDRCIWPFNRDKLIEIGGGMEE